MEKYDIAKTNLRQCFKYWAKYDQNEGKVVYGGFRKLLSKIEEVNLTEDQELMLLEFFETILEVEGDGKDET